MEKILEEVEAPPGLEFVELFNREGELAATIEIDGIVRAKSITDFGEALNAKAKEHGFSIAGVALKNAAGGPADVATQVTHIEEVNRAKKEEEPDRTSGTVVNRGHPGPEGPDETGGMRPR